MHEVFLSHASRNHAQARRLREWLVAHGIPVWISSHHIAGAQLWHEEIGQALKRCEWFVVVLTPDAVKSRWVKNELHYALNAERYQGRIIPLVFKKRDYSDLSWMLPQIQYVDFTKNFEHGCEELLGILKKRRRA